MAFDPAAIAELLNAASAEAAALPRVVAWPQELPRLSAADVERRREAGWLADGLFTSERDGRLVSLADVRVNDDKGELGWFATHPEERRHGLATACLKQALGFLRDRGAKMVQTASFVDSRLTSACAFLETRGFTVRDPQRQNIVMQIDMQAYQPVPIVLPEGYRLESLRPEWVPLWVETMNRVFSGTSPTEWFERTFSHRADFEWEGWLTLWRGEEMIGISAADLFRDAGCGGAYCGAQIEYVGVVEGHRGLRLGEMLVCACLNYVKARDLPCQLITQEFRVPAVTLYERLGFRKVRENRTYEREL